MFNEVHCIISINKQFSLKIFLKENLLDFFLMITTVYTRHMEVYHKHNEKF